MKSGGALPLCVGLDGGALRNGLAAEAVWATLKRDPGLALRVLPRLPGGARSVGRTLAGRVSALRAAWDEGVLGAVDEARAAGRPTVLVTTSPGPLVRALGAQLERFDDVLIREGEDPSALGPALAERFGAGGFDFVGSASERAAVAPFAREVRPPPPHPERRSTAASVRRAVRMHQWLKNLLVFLPVLAGQRFSEPGVVLRAVAAFAAFSLVASTVYVLNDLLDLPDDRQHPTKRNRPFASGDLSLGWAPWLVLIMPAGAAALCAFLPPAFVGWLGVYLVLTFAYSLKLKGAILVDVVTLAGLYTLRIIAGAAATGIQPSVWLLGFSLFFFLSLALVKRYAELHDKMAVEAVPPADGLPGRSYQPRDLPVLIALGVATGCVAVLVLALYVISDEFARHYRYPVLLWQLCPLALYWIGRAWIVVARDEMTDDPVVWAVRDQLSRWVGIIAILILVLAR